MLRAFRIVSSASVKVLERLASKLAISADTRVATLSVGAQGSTVI
jgi:hypothetical protein